MKHLRGEKLSESDKKELEKMVQEEEQELEELLREKKPDKWQRRLLYARIAASVWLLYMELKKQRENFYSIGRRGARGVLPVIGGATSSKKAKKSTKRRYQSRVRAGPKRS
mgnify:CR=1 FL=1